MVNGKWKIEKIVNVEWKMVSEKCCKTLLIPAFNYIVLVR